MHQAHTLRDLKTAGYASFTKLYEEINAGRLIATKVGRRTIILDEYLKAWLDSLPRM